MTAVRPTLLLLALVAAPTAARAEQILDQPTPATLYLAAGPGLTIERDATFMGAAIDGGVRVGGRWWGHVAGRLGALSLHSVEHLEFRAGAEARTCAPSGAKCGSAGVDLGFQQTEVGADGGAVTSTTGLLVPHLGADIGDDTLRLRVQVELRGYAGTRTDAQGDHAMRGVGLGFGAALGIQW